MSDESSKKSRKRNPFSVARQIQEAVMEAMGGMAEDLEDVYTGEAWPFEVQPKFRTKDLKEEVRVYVDLPGVAEDDVELEVQKDILIVTAHRHDPDVEDDEGHKVRRRIHLPAEVKAEKADASLKDGVLTVILPKKEAPKSVKINLRKEG